MQISISFLFIIIGFLFFAFLLLIPFYVVVCRTLSCRFFDLAYDADQSDVIAFRHAVFIAHCPVGNESFHAFLVFPRI